MINQAVRGARLGVPAAHVQKSLARPSAALSKSVKSALSRLRTAVHRFQEWHAVFNTFNMPPLHHIDYGAFVRAWKKEGTQRMGTLKGASSTTGDDDGVDRSEVIRRHLSAGAGTPLYT